MKKAVKFTFSLILAVVLCVGCTVREKQPYISNKYVLEYEGDKCYMCFEGESKPKENDGTCIITEPVIGLPSLVDFKDSLLNHKFTEEQLNTIRSYFNKGDNNRIEICNPNKLYQAVCPEDLEFKYFYWQGLTYKWLIDRPRIRGEAFRYITKDIYDEYLQDKYYEFSGMATVTKTETIEDRNSTVYYYTSSDDEYKRVCYVLEQGDKTLYIAEEHKLNETQPILTDIMGKQGEAYFHVDLITEERPTAEYLLEFGLREL